MSEQATAWLQMQEEFARAASALTGMKAQLTTQGGSAEVAEQIVLESIRMSRGTQQ
jgi:hypothetical protein